MTVVVRRDVGAAREQQLQRVEAILRRREDERRPAVRLVFRVDVGAAIEQRLDRLDVARLCRQMQRLHAGRRERSRPCCRPRADAPPPRA